MKAYIYVAMIVAYSITVSAKINQHHDGRINDLIKDQDNKIFRENQLQLNANDAIIEDARTNQQPENAMAMNAESRGIVCPPAAAIAPCTCGSFLWGTGVELNCYNQGLTDSQLSSKLNLFLSTGISPLLCLNASSNGLTKVPDLLPKFASLWIIDLSNNQITALPPGAFSYPLAKYLLVYLQDNQIKSIPYDSFNSPRAGTVMIYLTSNQITAIPSGVFNFPIAFNITIFLYYNRMSSLPSKMFNYPVARYINIQLQGNQITAIPSGMFNYPQVIAADIYFSYNPITFIPSGMFSYPLATSVAIHLDYNKITSITSSSFIYPSVVSLALWLNANQLTSIPAGGMFNYPKATSVYFDIAALYQMSHIPAGSFNFPSATNVWLSLYHGNIKSIGTGCFQAKSFSYFTILGNQLTEFPSSVFKSVLNTCANSSFDIRENAIDCSSCNLAWLIRDNRQLLSTIIGGTCSNGTELTNLNPSGFENCS